MNNEVVIGGTYKHFKGHTAKVIAVATHTETGEKLVVYKCAPANENSNHISGIYARPLDMFLSEVDYDKYPDAAQKMRFELIEQ